MLIRSFLGVSLKERIAEMRHEEMHIARKAETEDRLRSSQFHYKRAMEYLLIGEAFDVAYELAVKYRFTKLFNTFSEKEIKWLEKSGLYDKCARLEQIRGNAARAQMYRTLDIM